jgi:hemerythrin superfamily protein
MMTKASDRDNESPVETFTNCHVGIIGTMRDLADLPALLEPARRFHAVSTRIEEFFEKVVRVHHQEEEEELFPAVLSSAIAGEERSEVHQIISRLTNEHRNIEASFAKLIPIVKAASKDFETELSAHDIDALVNVCLDHARYEEEVFLPLAKSILGRNGDHMAALGMSLHMRHATSIARGNFGAI